MIVNLYIQKPDEKIFLELRKLLKEQRYSLGEFIVMAAKVYLAVHKS